MPTSRQEVFVDSGLVHILDDDAAYRDSLAQLIFTLGFQTVCYGSANEYLQAEADLPGCLILDLKLADRSGLAVLADLARRSGAHPVIVLTGHANVPAIVQAYQSGRVIAFLQKQSMSELALLEAIQEAIGQDLARREILARRESVIDRLQKLSENERQVLDRLLKGAEHNRIAEELGISRRTVENRRAKIMKKLNATTLPELVRIAVEAGYR